MSEQIKRLITIDSIPGETEEQQADRLSIESNLDDASAKYKLSQIYGSTLGDNASMDKIISTLESMINNPTKSEESNVINNKEVEEVKIKEDEQIERGKTMAENMFSDLQGTGALNNVGTKAPAKAPKAEGELSEALLKSLSENGISVDQVKSLMANKDKLANLSGGSVKVEKYFAVKEPAFDRLNEYKADNVNEAYTLGQTVQGRLGYVVRPSMKGDVNNDKFQARVAEIKAEVIKKCGYNENGGVPSAASSATNPQHIKNLINILDSATTLGDNETPDTYKGIVPDDKLASHPGKVLVGNNVFLADVDNASKTWSYKAVKLSDKDAVEDVKGTKYNEISFPAAGSYMKKNGMSMIMATDGKSAIVLKQGKKKVNGVEQIIDTMGIDSKKDIDKSHRSLVARTKNQKIGFIRVDAKLIQPITYTEQNSKGKAVSKKLKIKVYAKVYADYELTGTNYNPCLSVAKAKATGTGRATTSMLSDFSSGNISLETVAKFMKRMKKQGIQF